ncbi:MAG TPA: hypothetical protein VLT91_06300 [Rhizomicrobium sp.]|nr:hypothetical protein [Rhizomicrobium sp.]
MDDLHLGPWHDFYIMMGGSGGALVGATFVVATLAGNIEKRAIGIKGFITPATVHLGSVVIAAAILMVPTLTPLFLALLLGTGGLAGLVYGIIVYFRVTQLNIDMIDRFWYGIFPILMYGLLAVSAALVFFRDIGHGLELIATALVAMLVIGMRNAWDMATFMILGGPAGSNSDSGTR